MEMVKYKAGDRVKILQDKKYSHILGRGYKKGEIYIVDGIDDDGDPWFVGDTDRKYGYTNATQWFEKIISSSDMPVLPAHY